MRIRRFSDTGEWTTRRYLSLIGNLLIWAIVAIDAFYLWPTQLQGSTSMVIVSGRSMEPTYFSGDLVIARKMDPTVGDVIVYA
ncbi:MAG: S26 family signal peptidase, partial [Demequinaceae bacterium]|nr:S26 family signal peptidase [Demequinaceae bacterium]